MPKYRVVEIVWYEYEAPSESAAVEACEEDGDRDEKVVSVQERYAVEVDDEGNAK